MFSGTRPDNLGVKNGRFAPCKPTPNCVSSQAEPSDREHYIEPIAFRGAMAKLRAVVESTARAKVIEQNGSYLYAEYTSALMGYVDDVELFYDESAGLVHVRSASRLGRSDFGVNRKRVEELRQRLK